MSFRNALFASVNFDSSRGAGRGWRVRDETSAA
jgi:hypothetical protein